MKTIAAHLSKTLSEIEFPRRHHGQPLLENQVGEYRASLTLLLVAVGVVLLIACANLANLLAARGAARAREFGIRAAIGACRWQIVRQLLSESLILALFGGALGLALAAWGRDLIVVLAPTGTSVFREHSLDGWVMAFSLSTGRRDELLFGLWPAWHCFARPTFNSHLKPVRRQLGLTGARRSREFLIVAEVALTLVLLTTAALVLKSFATRVAVVRLQARQSVDRAGRFADPTYDDAKRLTLFTTGNREQTPSSSPVSKNSRSPPIHHS